MGMGYGGHMMYGGWFMWIIIIAIIVLVIYLLARQRRPDLSEKASPETAMDILKKRFARGEIAKEEFDNMKKNLE
ncbi:MAG: SHOCT domain-containing protein [Desulfobacteraceae bacterium]|nr:MAG: SHOCT domain-containing protein [Desulfobacteraceae bacterium]